MSNKSFNSGDVIIKTLNLSSLDGERQINIVEQAQVIDVYESIVSPVITGSIVMLDNVALRENFPIIGGKCKVNIQFFTPDPDSSKVIRTIEFIVTEVNNVQTDEHALGSTYELSLASVEILENAKAYFREPLKNDTIQNHVVKILTDKLKTKKPIIKDTRDTKGNQRMDVINLKPFQAIDILKKYAVSNFYKSNVFTFFENKSGFNFLPLEYLLSDDSRLIKDAIFFYDSNSKTNVKNITFRNILTYKHIVQESPTSLIHLGALNNKTNNFDIKTRTTQTVEYKYSTAKDEFKYSRGSRPIHKASFEQTYTDSLAHTFNVVQNSTLPESYAHEKIGYAQAFTAMLTQNILRIMVWGDSMLSAGFKVRIETPKTEGLTKAGGKPKIEKSDFVSGEFLISHIRHSFSKINIGYRHFTSMELVNVAYGKSGGFT